mmetsp:Transcript_23266/g.28644  ORF Transcript_23266/g.28644 Transcript_23266/m.28644 type:complete len:294 (+) Transcript_23266:308-1189(+)
MVLKIDIVWMGKGWHSLIPIFSEKLKKELPSHVAATIRVARRTPHDEIDPSSLNGASMLIPTMEKCGPDELRAAGSNLKLVYQPAAGHENIDSQACKELGIPFCNCSGKNAVSTAEGTVMLMLAMTRRLTEGIEKVRKEATIGAPTGHTLQGKKVGIIGGGKIGKTFEKMCTAAFGMQTCSTTSKSSRRELEDLLRTSDIVSVHCPLTENTRGLLGKKELEMMKRSAVLINTARGHIVDKHALAKALQENSLQGYATDVFWDEPAVSTRFSAPKSETHIHSCFVFHRTLQIPS